MVRGLTETSSPKNTTICEYIQEEVVFDDYLYILSMRTQRDVLYQNQKEHISV